MNLDPFMHNLAALLHDLPQGRREAILTVTMQLRRYAALMEQAAAMSQAVFAGAHKDKVACMILDGAGRIGHYRAGAFILETDDHPTIAVAYGEFAGTEGRPAPVELTAARVTRVGPERLGAMNMALGIELPPHELYLA